MLMQWVETYPDVPGREGGEVPRQVRGVGLHSKVVRQQPGERLPVSLLHGFSCCSRGLGVELLQCLVD